MKKFMLVLVALIGLSLAPASRADDGVVGKLDEIISYLNQWFYSLSPWAPKAAETNKKLATVMSGNDAGYALSLKATENMLDPKDTAKQVEQLSNGIFASDTFTIPKDVSPFSSKQEGDAREGDRNFTADSLLVPIVYKDYNQADPQNTRAYMFIKSVGGLYQPISKISFQGLDKEKVQEVLDDSSYQNYQVALRSYIAGQSVGLNNLYYLFAERIPQQAADGESALQLQQDIATRRARDPEWSEKMASANPGAVARETLNVLVEIQQQLFIMQQQNERLLAVMSVMQLQNNQVNKMNIKTLEGPVRNKIDELKGKKKGNQPTGSQSGSSSGLKPGKVPGL